MVMMETTKSELTVEEEEEEAAAESGRRRRKQELKLAKSLPYNLAVKTLDITDATDDETTTTSDDDDNDDDDRLHRRKLSIRKEVLRKSPSMPLRVVVRNPRLSLDDDSILLEQSGAIRRIVQQVSIAEKKRVLCHNYLMGCRKEKKQVTGLDFSNLLRKRLQNCKTSD